MKNKFIKKTLSLIIIVASLTVTISNSTFNTLAATTSSNISWPTAPEIQSTNAILIDADTGGILYEKNAYDKCYPASTTKILTGLLTVENCSMNEIVTFSDAAAHSVAWDDANLATKTGEQYTVEQSLYALLLYSANEVAYGLAEHVAGSLGNFTNLMNQRAKELGAVNTHFANASGLYDSQHYTTPYDMAMIARGCYNNTSFVNIDSTYQTYTIGPTNVTSENRIFKHRHQMLQNRPYYYQYCKGGKTGYTDQSGYTLVTFAEKDNMRLICVCFNAPNDSQRYIDTTSLFKWGFDNFKKVSAIGSSLSSAFSDTDYYHSTILNNTTHKFNLDISAITIPNSANINDINIIADNNYQPSIANGIYTSHVLAKYGDNIVASSTLTFGRSTIPTDSSLPYLEEENSNNSSQNFLTKWKLSINIYVIILIIVAALILFYLRDNKIMAQNRELFIRRSQSRKRRRKYR